MLVYVSLLYLLTLYIFNNCNFCLDHIVDILGVVIHGVGGPCQCVMRQICLLLDGPSLQTHVVKKLTCFAMFKQPLNFSSMMYLSSHIIT